MLRAGDRDSNSAQAALPRALRTQVLEALAAPQGSGGAGRLTIGASHDDRVPPFSLQSIDAPAARARYLLAFATGRFLATQDPRLERLTPRERQIAEQVARGLRNPEIARDLRLSVRTIENHLRTVYSKLQVRNRASLAGLLCALGAQPAGRIVARSPGDAYKPSTSATRRFRTAA
jgi:DNA-binding CsgD family transcriptional regulator